MNNLNGSSTGTQYNTDNGSDKDQSASEQDGTKSSLIVNYLPQTMTQDEVRSLFATVGELESCKLIRDKVTVMEGSLNSPLITGHSLGYAFVNFIRPEDAERAIRTMNGLKLQNKTIKVSYSRPSSAQIKGANLYVSGLPRHLTKDGLEAIFSPYGRIITSRILYENVPGENQPGASRGVGFIRFDQRQQAETAIEKLDGTTPDGNIDPIKVKFANAPATRQNKVMLQPFGSYPRQMSGNVGNIAGPILNMRSTAGRFRYSPLGGVGDMLSGNMNDSNSSGWCLFIYNLGPETEESALWQLFGPFGAVQSVKVIRDLQTYECKGFGFVTMTNYDDALMAIQALNGYMMGNRVLQVSFKANNNGQTKTRIR